MEISVAKVESFLNEMAELKQRVADLERANGLAGAIPRGQTITAVDPNDGSRLAQIGTMVDGVSVGSEFFDAAGNIVARFGQLDGATRDGAEIFTPGGVRTMRVDNRGAIEPNVHIPFAILADVSVNSGTFTTTHKGVVFKMKNPYLHLQADIDCDTGTTAELRFEASRVGSPGGTQTSAVRVIPSGFLNTVHLYFQVDMVLDAKATFFMEARRTSGAGAVRVSMPYVDWGDYSALATTGGLWT